MKKPLMSLSALLLAAGVTGAAFAQQGTPLAQEKGKGEAWGDAPQGPASCSGPWSGPQRRGVVAAVEARPAVPQRASSG